MSDEPRRLPDPIEALARELAILERRGLTLTGPERRLLEGYRGQNDEVYRLRRGRFRVIPGGKT